MLICVTNRKLCQEDFIARIKQIAQGKPYAIMLREKDLSPSEFEGLAAMVQEICVQHQVKLILSHNPDAALKMNLPVHLSMEEFRQYKQHISAFLQVGASIHSVKEAEEAQQIGAAYVIAGHIFSTDCKKGVQPRGLSFLKAVCEAVEIPVFAIGGVTADSVEQVRATGAKGICVMSETMICRRPAELAARFQF